VFGCGGSSATRVAQPREASRGLPKVLFARVEIVCNREVCNFVPYFEASSMRVDLNFGVVIA
jgi:hypothetical protein